MSTVQCHSCKAEVPLETARARGGMWPGFLCANCFRRQCETAFLVVGAAAVLFFIVGNAIESSKKSRNRDTQIPSVGLASIYDASYSKRGVTTRAQEMIPYLLGDYQYVSNWQEMLFEPISSSELQRAGFGFTKVLMDEQNVGSIYGPQTPDTVTILVKAKQQNYYFTVTQNKSAQ